MLALNMANAFGGIRVYAIGAALIAAAADPASAQALSEGCAAINATTGFTAVAPGPVVPIVGAAGAGNGVAFFAGEQITFSGEVTVAIDLPDVFLSFSDAVTTLIIEDDFDTIGLAVGSTLNFTVAVSDVVAANGDVFVEASSPIAAGTIAFTVTCAPPTATALTSATQTAARTAITQAAALTLGRTRSIVTNRTPDARRPDAPQATASLGAQAWSLGREANGAAGQGAGTPLGVWADFTWTGLEDDSAVVDSNTDAFTITGGLDAEIAPGIVFGASLSLGRVLSEARNNDLKVNETSVSVTPYFAYRLDDRFSLQGLAGYGYGAGGVTVEATGVDGDYNSHRYYVALEVAYFDQWGDASVYAGIGALYGQSFRLGFTDSGGERFGTQRTDIGTVSVVAQPAYFFALERAIGVDIEPFATFEYGYDFDITKITNATNDRDAFRIGAGAYLYGGDSLSGTLEASRMLGREDQDESTAKATVRVDF